jgi:hypothetical protein
MVKPRIRSLPAALGSRGQELVELAERLGYTLDPWQKLAVNDVLATNDAGALAAFEAVPIVARQCGKSLVGELNLGLAVLARGDTDRAADHLSEALTLFAATGSVAAGDTFLGLAALADAKDEARRAARLFGASNRVVEELGQPRDVHEAVLYENTQTAIRTALGEQTAAQLFAEGKKMPRDEAISYASRALAE